MPKIENVKELISFRLRPDFIARLRTVAEQKGISLVSLVEEAIILILERYEQRSVKEHERE